MAARVARVVWAVGTRWPALAGRWPIARHRRAALLLGCLLLSAWLSRELTAAQGNLPSLVISEVAPYADLSSATGEWVELYNAEDFPVDLAGWSLVVGGVGEPLAGTVPARAFFLVTASQDFADSHSACGAYVASDGCLGHGLGGWGSSVRLQYSDGASGLTQLGDSMSYGVDTTACQHLPVPALGLSLQRTSLTSPMECAFVTEALSPCDGPPAPAPTATATPEPTPTVALQAVLITEVNYRGGCDVEWVEVYNASAAAVDLSGWQLRDNTLATTLAAVLQPGEAALVLGSGGQVAPVCPARIVALASSCVGNGLSDAGDRLALDDGSGRTIDAMSYGQPGTAGAPLAPEGLSLARYAEGDGTFASWSANVPQPGCLQTRPAATAEPTQSVTPVASATPEPTTVPQQQPFHVMYLPVAWQRDAVSLPATLLISEVLADGITTDEGDEFVELRNLTSTTLALEGMLLGDAERVGDGEAMYVFPVGAAMPPGGILVVARCAAAYAGRFGSQPDYEFVSGGCADTAVVPNLARAAQYGSSPFALANSGDEVRLLSAEGALVDSVAFGNGDYAAAGLEGDADASEPLSLQRVAGLDRDDMSLDFSTEAPSPGLGLDLPAPSSPYPPPGWSGFYCFWGNLHAHTSSSDGAGPAELAFARARAAGLHFYAITDHDHWLRPVEWGRTFSAAGDATVPGDFVALAGIEWTSASEGHVNLIGGHELVSQADPALADLSGLYSWLATRPAVVAQFNHPGRGAAYGGQRQAGSAPEVGLQEVGNGAGLRLYEEELLLSWRNGWHVAPTIGSDTHTTAWGSDLDARTAVWAAGLDTAALMEALRSGRVLATTDPNAALGWRCGETWMGGDPPADGASSCSLFYDDDDGEAASVQALDFTGALLGQWPLSAGVQQDFAWPVGSEALWLKAVQPDGDAIWAAPIWREPGAP